MTIPFTCPHCGVRTDVDEQFAGQTGPCHHCAKTVTVPGSWTTHHSGGGSGSGSVSTVVVVVAIVVFLLFALLVCGGLAVFTMVARTNQVIVQPPARVASDEASGWSSMPKEYYASPAPDRFTREHLVPADGSLPELLNREAAEAKAAGRTPYVEFGLSNAQPCRDLDESLSDERMIDAFAGTHIVHLDIRDWGNRPPGTEFRVDAVPAFFEIDDEGRPTGRSIDGNAWGENVPENMAPPLKDFFQGGL